MNLQKLDTISFPTPNGINVNMMPFIFGDKNSLPREVQGYVPLIEAAKLEKGKLAYLTVHESFVPKGKTQRRPGVHTDGTSSVSWGGGGWGGISPSKGIYVASNDGRCKAWDMRTNDVDHHGSLLTLPQEDGINMEANTLYWFTDRTPHEALPSEHGNYRQFYRLVADEIGVWWKKHSTLNPFGILPNAPIVEESKF